MPVPSFTINGKGVVKTIPGMCFTFLLTVVMFYYGLSRLDRLIRRSDVDILAYNDVAFFSSDTRTNLNDDGFMFAFSIVGYSDRQVRDDPDFVEWAVYLTE